MITKVIKAKRADVIRASVAELLHERTKRGLSSTIAEIADELRCYKPQALSALRLLQHHPQPTRYGFVKAVEAGKRTSATGVTATVYAAILHHENVDQ